jgi:hypothetical protein
LLGRQGWISHAVVMCHKFQNNRGRMRGVDTGR